MTSSTLPRTMRAIRVAEDDHHSLIWDEIACPRPARGEVLIRVAATAVNRSDLLQRLGRYPVPPGASPILGIECSGTVVSVSVGVRRWRVGDRVCALLNGGGYAEYAACPGSLLFPVPNHLDLKDAAALPEALCTAYLNIYMEAKAEPGQHVLVHAAASGIGTMAVQLCRVLGSPVYGTASPSKLDLLRQLGAVLAIDRSSEDFVERVLMQTGGAGADVILDPVGGNYLQRNIACLAEQGRIVVIGLLGGTMGQLPMDRLLHKQQRVIGSVLRPRSVSEKSNLVATLEKAAWSHVTHGSIRPVIDRVLPITKIEEAHAAIRANSTAGKVVLEIPL